MANIEINNVLSKSEAIELVTFLTEMKIRRQEQQIGAADSEEDIKLKEAGIARLQTQLQQIRETIGTFRNSALLSSNLTIR